MTDSPLIYSRMAQVLHELPAIGKDRRNTQQGFSFRGIDDVLDALNPILGKHGIFFVPEVIQSELHEEVRSGKPWTRAVLRVRYTFYASDGSSVSGVGEGEGLDNADKATSKAMSMALKYVLFQTFAIATSEDKDADATTPPERDAPAEKSPPPADAPMFACKVDGCDVSGYAPDMVNHVEAAHGWVKGDDGKMHPPAEKPAAEPRKALGAARAGKDKASDPAPTEDDAELTAEDVEMLRSSLSSMIGKLDSNGTRMWSTWRKAHDMPDAYAEMSAKQITDASEFVAPLVPSAA